MSDGSASPPLVGRVRECNRASDALAAARAGAGRLLILDGAWGAGKTRMLDEIARWASGFRVLRARGSMSEQGFPLGVARDLLESDSVLDGPWPAGQVGDVIRTLVQLTLGCASRTPLLLVVDDLHWADEPSLRYLAQLAPRMSASHVVIVLAWSAAEPGASAVEALFGSAGERLALEPFDEPAIAELLEHADPDWGPLASPMWIAGGGRALLTVELCRGLAAQPPAAAEALIGTVGERAPNGLVRRVAHRLAGHGAAATALARAVAVLGSEASLRLAATVAKLELEDAARTSDTLTSAGLLAPTTPLAFAAPVLRAVTYETIPRGERALLHLAAARALAAAGVGEEAVVAHLMLSEPAGDPQSLALLRQAAGQARGAGELGRTASLLTRAVAEAPTEKERNEVLLALGKVEATLRLPDAQAHLEQPRRAGGPGGAEATLALADLELLAGRPDAAAELLCGVSTDPDLALMLAAELQACEIAAGAAESGGDGIEVASAATSGERARLQVISASAALAGQPRTVVLQLARASQDSSVPGEGSLGPGASLLARVAIETVEPAPADLARIETELAAARSRCAVAWEAVLLTLRARTLVGTGPLGRAEADARRALALSREHALALVEPFALAALVEALLDQGRLADAQHALVAAGQTEAAPHDLGTCLVTIARGRLQAAAGAAHLGMRGLLAAGARLLRGGCCTPGYDWRSRAGLIAHRLDHHAEAQRLIDDELTLARRIGAPRAIGRALRAQALLAPPARQIELLEESADILRGTPAKLDCARALCDLGAARRRSGARSLGRQPLLDALQLAHECDAVALAQRTRHELIALGARPRRHAVTGVEALTAREREASELAAQGLTNRQIAAVMTVTPNTVEYHLTNAYRKLGITTRDHLAAELGLSERAGLITQASDLASRAQIA